MSELKQCELCLEMTACKLCGTCQECLDKDKRPTPDQTNEEIAREVALEVAPKIGHTIEDAFEETKEHRIALEAALSALQRVRPE